MFGVGYHDILSVTLFFRIKEGEGGEDQLLGVLVRRISSRKVADLVPSFDYIFGLGVFLFLIANKCNENFRVQASNNAQTFVIHVYLFYPGILYIHTMHLHMRLFFSLKTSLQFGTCYLVSSLGSREVRPSIFPTHDAQMGLVYFPTFMYLLNYSVL